MATSDDPGYRAEQVRERVAGAHDETKWAPLTTESSYIVSRGIAKPDTERAGYARPSRRRR